MIFKSIFNSYKSYYKFIIYTVLFLNLFFIKLNLFSKDNKDGFNYDHLNFSGSFPNLIFGVDPQNKYEDNNFSSEGSESGASYIFTVKMPKDIIKDIPNISGYYKGEQLNFDSNFCIIYEDLKATSFTLVVTSDISRKAEEKNVYCLERKENLPCKLFYVNQVEKISKAGTSNDYDIEWHIEKENNIKSMPKKLPDNAIVILLDPDYVDDFKVLENQKNIEINGKAVIIRLPVLFLRLKNNDINSFKDSFDKALIAAIDQRPFHRNSSESIITKIEASNPSTIITARSRVNS